MQSYPRIIAHRCGGALAPENTLVGLDIAAVIGCQGVEFDVMLSRDGVPVLIHDEDLARTTNGKGLVAHTDAASLLALDAGVRHHKAYIGTPLPSFDATLARLAQHKLWANVEIKPAPGHERATGIVVGQRLAEGLPAGGIVSSFSLDALHAARACNPTLPLAVLFESLPDDWATHVDALGAHAVHLAARHVTPAVSHQLKDITWACYTVNTIKDAAQLFALGCHAVFSDRPDLWA
jgi:glycerophosphoryl diester phosphodiesterase